MGNLKFKIIEDGQIMIRVHVESMLSEYPGNDFILQN